jgi:uncharacterized protein
MKNAFAHIELMTGDVARAKEFYSRVFSWSLEDMPMGPEMTYTMVRPGEGPGGGMMQKPMPDAPTMWLPYVNVESRADTIERARSLGAHVIVEHQEVPGMGQFGIFVDPTGAMLAVWQPVERPKPAAKKAARRPAKKAAKKPAKKAAKKPAKKAAKKPAKKAAKRR